MFDKQLRVPPTLGSDYRTADQWGVAHSIKIHAIQTGSVAIRPNQRQGKGTGVLRLINTLTDRRWTEPLPIYVWVIPFIYQHTIQKLVRDWSTSGSCQ